MEEEIVNQSIPPEIHPSSTIRAHLDSVDFIRLYTKTSNLLVSASHDKSLKIWDIERQNCLNSLLGHTDAVFCCDINSAGNVASCSPDETVRIWDIKSAKEVSRGLGHNYKIYFVLFINDHELVSCGRDRKILQWDLKKMNSPVRRFGNDSSGTFRGLSYLNNLLVACTAESGLEGYSYNNGASVFKEKVDFDLSAFPHDKVFLEEPSIIYGLRFLPNQELLTAHQDMAIRKFSAGPRLEQNMIRRCHYESVRHIELFSNDDRFITTCQDGSGRIWQHFRPVYTLTGHAQISSCACVMPDSSRCFVSSYDQSISIYELGN